MSNSHFQENFQLAMAGKQRASKLSCGQLNPAVRTQTWLHPLHIQVGRTRFNLTSSKFLGTKYQVSRHKTQPIHCIHITVPGGRRYYRNRSRIVIPKCLVSVSESNFAHPWVSVSVSVSNLSFFGYPTKKMGDFFNFYLIPLPRSWYQYRNRNRILHIPGSRNRYRNRPDLFLVSIS